MRSSEELENILTTNYTEDDFPAVWNYGKLSDKFLVSSIKVIYKVGFLSLFKVLLEQLSKGLLTGHYELNS